MVPRDMPPGPELPAVEPGETRDSPSVAAGSASDADSPSRRRFLKASAAAAGGSLLGGCLGEDSTPTTFRLGGAALDTFDHTVVVMFENRSLDSLPGYLYKSATVPPHKTYNGLADGDHRCRVPPHIKDGHDFVSARISPGTDADMMNPNPDPGEEYQHVNTQLFNLVDPIGNQFKTAGEMVAPYNAASPGQSPTMDGFVWDYCNTFVTTKGRNPKLAQGRFGK